MFVFYQKPTLDQLLEMFSEKNRREAHEFMHLDENKKYRNMTDDELKVEVDAGNEHCMMYTRAFVIYFA